MAPDSNDFKNKGNSRGTLARLGLSRRTGAEGGKPALVRANIADAIAALGRSQAVKMGVKSGVIL